MVPELQLRHRRRLPVLALSLSLALALPASAQADTATGQRHLGDAQALYRSGSYFKAARYAFAAVDEDPSVRAEAYSWITLGLCQAGLHNTASYFFIRTLQSGNKDATRRVLGKTQELMTHVGADLIRKYLVRHTQYEDYDAANRSAYLYSLGKETLLAGDEAKAVGYLNGISKGSAMRPFALQLRGAAYAIQGKADQAIADFRECEERASDIVGGAAPKTPRVARIRREAEDLESRCAAGIARTLYQVNRFDEADRAYDRISKRSFVWPDILFEQAWNSFARQEYNRSLGKLVTYKSPALAFVYNSEVDVLRAQSYLALCLYGDANDTINDFNSKYTKLGEQVKRYVESRSNDLNSFYDVGKKALQSPLYSSSEFNRLANRFVRGPYFQNLVANESEIRAELAAIGQFASMQPGVTRDPGEGFPGFLKQVLSWRDRSIRLLGGTFVKNSLMDYHRALIADFEKMAFIKLEMLKRAKERLVFKKPSAAERGWGNVEPSRRGDQFFWSFNGEFWNDELGDYVFGLESECTSES